MLRVQLTDSKQEGVVIDAMQRERTDEYHEVVERTRQAITAKDLTTLADATEALNRTLNMFRGVVSKTRG